MRIRIETGHDCGEQSNLEEARKLCGILELSCGRTEMSGVHAKAHQSKHKNVFPSHIPQFQN